MAWNWNCAKSASVPISWAVKLAAETSESSSETSTNTRRKPGRSDAEYCEYESRTFCNESVLPTDTSRCR